ncbi:hypothetical protein [Methylobacterium crusticola]|uniref:hypothetical protein n=1 Tax=Methylobacterium crusticola TaxID=1697972 RepID=UPI001EE18C57|nr:hypothetical protein [Methylobacterium crusticola]
MTSTQAIASTLTRLASPGMKPKALMAAVREQHPKASKKDVARAAFYAVIQHTDGTSDKVQQLHAFALGERLGDDDDVEPASKPRKKHKQRAAKP